ncbi:hypothetical protein AVANS14531_02445 [Campylobacter sp. Cr9]|uniref:hypothetical protein n=1 Tax=Campylobacter sp. Cr9 TaxID=2735728 RepID=UPI003014D1BC|nr:hypothetical protein [Campylobacter sp. Cr9]
MKKLLNFKTLTMVLLTATTLTATAATTDSVKTNTTTKVSKKVIDYSKMNYKQLEEECSKFTRDDDNRHSKIQILKLYHLKTDGDYDLIYRLSNELINDMIPLQKEINERVEKYKDNEEVYYMYKSLAEKINNRIRYVKNGIKSAEKKLKEIKMKEMY